MNLKKESLLIKVYVNLQGYPASKMLAEKAAWKFAEENDIDLITVIPSLTTGPSLTPDIPSSVGLAMSLITGSNQQNSTA
jgi:anthocyanidin reductase